MSFGGQIKKASIGSLFYLVDLIVLRFERVFHHIQRLHLDLADALG